MTSRLRPNLSKLAQAAVMISSHFSGEKTEAQVVRVPLELAGIPYSYWAQIPLPWAAAGQPGGLARAGEPDPLPTFRTGEVQSPHAFQTQQLIRKTLVAFINASPRAWRCVPTFHV